MPFVLAAGYKAFIITMNLSYRGSAYENNSRASAFKNIIKKISLQASAFDNANLDTFKGTSFLIF